MKQKRLAVARIEKLLQPEFTQRYFQRHVRTFAPGCTKALVISRIHLIKIYDDPQTRAFVAFYDVACGSKKLRVVGLAHSHELRRYEHVIHEKLARLLEQKRMSAMIPKPYWYDIERGALFLEYAPGRSLRSIMKHTQHVSAPLARATIEWLRNLQTVPPGRVAELRKQPPFETLTNNLAILRKRRHALAPQLTHIWHDWHNRWKKQPHTPTVIAHGDLNPMNIIVRKHKDRPSVTVIDFGRAHRGPKLWDLATMLSQCDTSLGFHLSQKRVRNIQQQFLKAWENAHGKLSKNARTELHYFQNYFHLLAVTHFLIWGDEQEPALQKQIHHLLQLL